MTDDARYQLIAKITQAFTPGSPIKSTDLFAGRQREIERAIGTVFQPGQHAVIYGERGVGKTSLANTLYDFMVLMGRYEYQRARLNCAERMTFADLWRTIFRQLSTKVDGEDVELDHSIPENPHSENIRELFELMDDPSIIIIDELDRVKESSVIAALADTIKTLSDNDIRTTLIMVGVADSLDQLIAEHRSIERAVRQIHMQRMSKSELLEIVDRGLKQCDGLAVDPSVRERLADYSQGLPYFTHLLAREAALHVVRSNRTYIIMPDLDDAIKEAVDGQLESLLESYRVAVTAPRGIYFKPALLACALATKDEQGWFYARDVREPLRAITTANQSIDIPQFAKHLNAFSDTSRGPILTKRGRQYRFVTPIMEPYVILRGLADHLITESQLSHPPTTSTEPEQLSLQLPSGPEESEPSL